MTNEELELARKGFSKNEIEEILSQNGSASPTEDNQKAVNEISKVGNESEEKNVEPKIEKIDNSQQAISKMIEQLESKFNYVNEKLDGITKSVQENNLKNAVIDTPKSESVDDILANILEDMPVIE